MVIGLFSLALAADISLPLTGALTDPGGAPYVGTHTLTVVIRAGANPGDAELWSGNVVAELVEGRFAARLGPSPTLTPSDFVADAWITVRVDGGPESPAVAIAHAPRAAFAEHAATATTAAALSAPMPWSNLADVPAGFADGVDANTTYTPGTGLTLSGAAFSVSQTQVEAWARGVAYDSGAEVTTAIGSGVYAPASIVSIPAPGWIPRWTGTQLVTSAMIQNSAGYIGINVGNAEAMLDVGGDVRATTFVSADATVREAGEYVFRMSLPLGFTGTSTSNSSWTRLSNQGIDLAGYINSVPQVSGTTRQLRFRTIYDDNTNPGTCGGGSYGSTIRVVRDDTQAVYVSWTQPGTFSSSGLTHLDVSQYFAASVLNHGGCDSGWSGGSCQVQFKLLDGCNGTAVVRDLILEIWDVVN